MKGEIRFGRDDFEGYFEMNGIEWDSITDPEWTKFENMFISGIGWDEIAETAAWEIAGAREENIGLDNA